MSPNSRILAASAVLAVILALPFSSGARADGYPTDIELLRPTFSYGSIPGLDTPDIEEEGQLRMGLLTQYQRDPLVLVEFENELGGIVSNRVAMQLGVSWDFFERAGARFTLPVAMNFASDIIELSADTVGLGDAGLGVRFLAVKTGGFKLGARADMMIPTNVPRDSWIGERDMRPIVGMLVRQDIGRFSALLDTNATIRSAITTEEDFRLGSELAVTPGLLFQVKPDLVNVYAEGLIRSGFSDFFKGGAENPIETVVGAQWFAKENILVDFGGGKGWTEGYGTTDFRIFAGLTYTFVKEEIPPPIEPEPVVELFEIPPENVEELVAEVKVWEEGQLARVENEQIVIKDPVEFFVDTSDIVPNSLPTLRYVAKLLNQKGEIAHIVIEGHASEEGDYLYNYDLSLRRARSIWEELVRSGVHPERMSIRSMGETVPIAVGEDEASLAQNRRVEFDIIKQLGPLDVAPKYPNDILLPWSGARSKVNEAPLGSEGPKEPERRILRPTTLDDAEDEATPTPSPEPTLDPDPESAPEGEPAPEPDAPRELPRIDPDQPE